MYYGSRQLRQQNKRTQPLNQQRREQFACGHVGMHRKPSTRQVDVYRFEITLSNLVDKTYGPFTADCHDQTLAKLCSRYRNHFISAPKTPEEDGCGHEPRWHEVCGCTDMEQLMYHWLPSRGLLNQMLDVGFRINHYKVDSDQLYQGDSQCIWNRAAATLVGMIDPDTLYSKLYDDVC